MCSTPAFLTAASMRSASVTRVGQRLLAEDDLARARGGDRDLGVRVARRADVDDVDVRRATTASQSVAVSSQPSVRAAASTLRRRAAAQHLQPRRQPRREERRDLPVRVAVRPAHERVADQRDVDLGRHQCFFVAGAVSAASASCRTIARASRARRSPPCVSLSLNGSIAVPFTPSVIVLTIVLRAAAVLPLARPRGSCP